MKLQYSGTAGRIENSQAGVFLAYRSAAGHAFTDRSLYLPKEWAEAEARRIEANLPESVTFATKAGYCEQKVDSARLPIHHWVQPTSGVYFASKKVTGTKQKQNFGLEIRPMLPTSALPGNEKTLVADQDSASSVLYAKGEPSQCAPLTEK